MGDEGMRKRRMAFIITTVVLAASLCACGGLRAPIAPPNTTPSPPAAITTDEITTSPATTEPVPTATGDLPAYVQAGLPARDKMTDLQKWYYYGEELPGADTKLCNVAFDGQTTADLDGDGKNETIRILPGKQAGQSSTEYEDVTVDIDGKQIKLQANREKDETFHMLGGTITDIDKADKQKELYIASYDLAETGNLITYSGGVIHCTHDIVQYANGTGYILGYKTIHYEEAKDYIWYPVVEKYRADKTGFDIQDMGYTTTRNFLADRYATAAETQSDQNLADKPGGTESILLKKGTKIFFVLFDGTKWVQVTDEKWNQLGWLNAEKTNLDDYTNDHFAGGD